MIDSEENLAERIARISHDQNVSTITAKYVALVEIRLENELRRRRLRNGT